MSIIVNGNVFRTLAEPLYVNGKHVIEAYANGEKVYPAGPTGDYFMKIRGKTLRHVKAFYPSFQHREPYIPERTEYGASNVEYDFSVSFAALIEWPKQFERMTDHKLISFPKPTIEKTNINVVYDPFSATNVTSPDVDGSLLFGGYHNNVARTRYTSQEGFRIHTRLKSGNYNQFVLPGSPDHDKEMFCSLIFSFYISNPEYTARTEHYESRNLDVLFPVTLKTWDIPSSVPFNITKLNGIYGPYYESFRNPNAIPGLKSDSESKNRWEIPLTGSFSDRPYYSFTPSLVSKIDRDENFQQNRDLFVTLDHFRLKIRFLGEKIFANHLIQITPPPGVDYAWQTVSAFVDLNGTINEMRSDDGLEIGSVCPITDILYAGDYVLAPEWAKILTPNDLL